MILSFFLFYKWIVILVILSAAAYGILQVWTHYNLLKTNLNQFWIDFKCESIAWKTIIGFTILIIVQTGIVCFSPLEYNGDAAAFYMVLPKLLIETKKLSLVGGYESFMTIGLQGEFHFATL
jgi:hypothetical protein